MRFILVTAICLLSTLASAQSAERSETDRRAEIHFQAGNSYYERGAYEDAIREFELSHELSGRPELLFNLYSAFERLGRLEEAEASLARYIAEDISDDQRQNATSRLEALRQRMSRQNDGSVEEPSEGLSAARKAAIAGWVVGAVGFIEFAAFAALSSSEASDLDTCRPSCTDDQVSTLRTYNILADIGLGVGIAGAVTGTILWIVGKPSPVSVEPRADGMSIRYQRSF